MAFGTDPLNPLPELITQLGNDLQNIPLVTLNGGNNADDGGLLGGVIGDITHSSSGHLLDLDAGPQDPNGQNVDVLSAPGDGSGNTVSANAVDVGPNGPHLADLGVLNGGGALNFTDLGGVGTDGLVGTIVSEVSGVAAPVAPAPAAEAPDMGLDLLGSVTNADHGVLDLHGTHIV